MIERSTHDKRIIFQNKQRSGHVLYAGLPIRRILAAKLFAARVSLLLLGAWLLVFGQLIIG